MRVVWLGLALLGVSCLPARAAEPAVAAAAPPPAEKAQEAEHAPETLSQGLFDPYEGLPIRALRIRGRVYTREDAVLALLGHRVGDKFSAETWYFGIRKLYNTTVIYDIVTKITEVKDAAGRGLEIDVHLIDKYPVLPNVNFQGGGGSQSVGLGLIHANVFGYFTNLSFQLMEFNELFSYDFNFFQEFLFDTDWVSGLDVQKAVLPVEAQDAAGNITQFYTWTRQQNQLLLGRRIGQRIRLYGFLEEYDDAIVGAPPGGATVLPGGQYRLHGQLIFGRSNFTNFLEEGYELTFQPWITDFFDSRFFAQLQASFKRTIILPPNDNLAFFVNTGAMTDAPMPYQYHLGGYDTTRGFSTYRHIGRAYAYGVAEYRPYLFSFRTSLLGLDLIAFQAAIFMDAGLILANAGFNERGPLTNLYGLWSAGGGVRINFVKIPQAIVRLDVARTIQPDEGTGFSFSLGQFF